MSRKLQGGDRRSIGQSNKVALQIAGDPALLSEVFALLLGSDPVLRMRAADAVEKATRERPELLQPYKRKLLKEAAAIEQQEVRWHVAQMLPRLRLSARERDSAIAILFDFLNDKSSIVKTFAMQALADFALQDFSLKRRVLPVLTFLAQNGTAAMRSRGRRLLALLHPS